mgnify:CR=1 FL=1
MKAHADIDFGPEGSARCLYHELIDLRQLGGLRITRASRLEFNVALQEWEVLPVVADEPPLFASASRTACLAWEREHLHP